MDTIGVLLQSIGGGGGNGGSAMAQTIVFDVPIPDTDIEVGAAISIALGGDGNAGGDGGKINSALSQSSSVITQGQGSHAILMQSIGGGGGNGGDSSAFSATIGYARAADQLADSTFDADISVALGGNGAAAGSGGDLSASLGDSTDGPAPSVITYGDYANAVIAQSVGGGGGNAGFGSSNTLSFGNTNTFTTSASLGGTGGQGGSGGTINIDSVSSSITTYGDGAHGFVLQSVGGGGGISQGGTLNVGVSFSMEIGDSGGESEGENGEDPDTQTISPSGSLTFELGETGGSGGYGHSINMVHSGDIATYGSDSIGILAQSVGGGGGIVGSAGADASADNPVVPASSTISAVRAFEDAVIDGEIPTPLDDLSLSASATVKLGSNCDGAGGNGTDIELTLNADSQIETHGDWSQGILAQSIGGGGGKAGSACYKGSAAKMQLNQCVGSNKDISGNGGIINISTSGNQISTNGYSAFGFVAQSIGGGGGFAADGSNSASGTIKVGPRGSSTGIGGSITIQSGSSMNIATQGQAAHAIILQSIAGGGGIGGAGNSALTPDYSDVTTKVGGSSGGYGNSESGTINFLETNLNLSTLDDYAFGLLAQSIGGGGGLASLRAPSGTPQVGTLNNSGSSCDGHPINISLANGTSFVTSGFGAHALVAQSIGGGGGIGGYGAGNVSMASSSGKTTIGNGSGDNISLTIDAGASLTTQGQQAYGIIAQSIGSGGGIIPSDTGTIYYGSTNGPSSVGGGGAVSITMNGTLHAENQDAGNVGILAQSTSASGSAEAITIDNGGTIQVSGPDAIAVWVSDGTNNNCLTNRGTIDANVCVKYSGQGNLTVNNQGVLTGNLGDNIIEEEPSARIALFNSPSGHYFAGSEICADILNEGIIEIRTSQQNGPFSHIQCHGDFSQTAQGKIIINADFSRQTSDILTISGQANLNGKLVLKGVPPKSSQSVLCLRFEGELTGSLEVETDWAQNVASKFTFKIERKDKELYVRCLEK